MNAPHLDTWNQCLQIIKENSTPQSFDTWFRPIRPKRLENQVLTIEVPSEFFYEWLESHYVDLLRKSIRSVLGKGGRLEYEILVETAAKNGVAVGGIAKGKQQNQKTLSEQIGDEPSVYEPLLPNSFVIPGIQRVAIESNLNPGFTFDNLIEGECNRMARGSGIAIAHKPGLYNPLFIYGGTGMGKTHLLQAVGNMAKQLHPQKNILYIYAEHFVNQFVSASRNNTVNDFMSYYQMMDILLVDDIHVLAGREKTQDRFFHIFNHLKNLGKQIVLSSDRPFNELHGIEERLISRFKWGVSACLSAPDFDTRLTILKNKVEVEGADLSPEVTEYIASQVTRNVRELEGALISLIVQSAVNQVDVDIYLAKSVLKDFVSKVSEDVSIEAIQRIVGEEMAIPVDDMKAKSRKREVVQARQIAMYFAKELTQESLKAIGDHFGGRDHSTVIHALQTVKDLMATDKNFKQSVNNIRKKLGLQLN